MSKCYAFYQGKIVKEDEVNISMRSKAFNYGLGCFEGIRAYWNEEEQQLYAFALKEHYERLLESCKALNISIPYTVEELCDYTVELLKKNNFKTTTYIRPIAYKGGETLAPTLSDEDNRILMYCQPMGNFAGKDALKVCVSSWRRVSDTALPPRTKATAAYLNSGLASLEAHQNGYDEAILLTESGHVCEGPGENLFIFKNDKLITPPASDNILEGITRSIIMQMAKEELGIEVVERSLARTELYNAKELFFSGTAMEVTPVIEVDNRKVGTGEPGEVCKKIKKLFFDVAVAKHPKYKHLCRPVY